MQYENRCLSSVLGLLLCRQLSDNSASLRSALDVVVQYEQQGAAILTRMLGTSYGVQDFLAYLLAAVAILGCGLSKATKGAQLPLLLLAVASLVAERMLMHNFSDHLDVTPAGQVSHSHTPDKMPGCQLGGSASSLPKHAIYIFEPGSEPHELLLQVVMHLPVPGLSFCPKTLSRRLCLCSGLLCVGWTMWRHTDNEQEALR